MLMALQVAVLTCHQEIVLPPFAALRHLLLTIASSTDPPNTYMKHASALETLSLSIFGEYANWSSDIIDLSSLHALKHVRIENYAPQELYVPDDCLLHIVWDGESTDDSSFTEWARVQSLWQQQSNCLGSLQICFQAGNFRSHNIAALRAMLTGDQGLAYISLCIPKLGSEKQPFSIDPDSCQMLALAERVRFRSGNVCSISVTNMQPKWKYLSINAARVNLEVEDTAALVRSQDNFWIEGVTSYGFTSLSMMHELHRSDRKYSVKRLTIEPAEPESWVNPQGFSFGTVLDCAARKDFEELMCCACSACLPCLSREGKLSSDSQPPKDCWREPVYDF